MSNSNVLPSSRTAIAGVVDPVDGTGTVTSGWVSVADYYNLMAIIAVGTLGASATVDAKIEQATDSSGTGAKDVTGKVITQLTQAGSDADKQAVIDMSHDDMDVDNSFTHARLSITVATADSPVAGILLGMDARNQPVTQPAAVDEVV